MKKLIIVSFIALQWLQNAQAGTKVQKVDLDDEKIVIIRGDLDVDNTYYHMDTKACICWMSVYPDISNPIAVSTFDCQNLGVYSKFKKAVDNCSSKVNKESEAMASKVESKASEISNSANVTSEQNKGPAPASTN